MGPFWAWRERNGVLLYGRIFKEFTPVWVCFLEGLHPYESLETGSREPPVASDLKPLTYGRLVTTPLWVYLIVLACTTMGKLLKPKPTHHIWKIREI